MDYSKVEMEGRLVLEVLSSIAPYTSSDSARMIHNSTDHSIAFGNPITGNWGNLIDVPRDAKILLESNTAVVGYTLLTDQDDDVIYITRGSVAGGEAGGSAKISGSWTQSTHSHSMSSHYHSISSHDHSLSSHTHTIYGHTHQYIYYASAGYTYSWDINGSLLRVQDYGTQHTTGLIVNVTNADPRSIVGHRYVEANTGGTSGVSVVNSGGVSGYNTGATDTASTDPSSTPNTWRPTGRNFTRQQRI